MEALKNVGQEFKDWAARPVGANMSLVDLGLTTAFVLTIAFLWTRILAQITD